MIEIVIEEFFYDGDFFHDLYDFLEYLNNNNIEEEYYEIYLTTERKPFVLSAYGILDRYIDSDLFEEDYYDSLKDFLNKNIDFEKINKNIPTFYDSNGNVTRIGHPFINGKNEVETTIL